MPLRMQLHSVRRRARKWSATCAPTVFAAGDHEVELLVFTPALRLKDVAVTRFRFARKMGVGSPFGDLAAALLRSCASRATPA